MSFAGGQKGVVTGELHPNPIDIFFVHLVIEPVVEQGPALCRCTLMEEEQPIYSFLDTDLERVDAPTVSQAHGEEEPDGAHLDPSLYPTPVHAPGTFVWHRQSGERDLYRVLDHLFPLHPGGFILTSCEGHTLLDDARVYHYPEQELIPADISIEDAKEIDTHYQVTPPPDPDRPRSFLEASKIRVRWVLEREVQRD